MIDANAIIELEALIRDGFDLLERAADMIEPDDHRKLRTIGSILEHKVLIHRPFIHTAWLKRQADEANDYLADMEGDC